MYKYIITWVENTGIRRMDVAKNNNELNNILDILKENGITGEVENYSREKYLQYVY